MTFDEWLMTQNTPEWAITSREIMRKAWDAATTAERERCKQKCKELGDEPPYKDYESAYFDGWIEACNECAGIISGCVPKSVVFTDVELCEAANIGKAYFENNKHIDIQIMGPDDKYSAGKER